MPQTFVYSAISQLTRFGKLDFWVFMATREPHLHQCAPPGADAAAFRGHSEGLTATAAPVKTHCWYVKQLLFKLTLVSRQRPAVSTKQHPSISYHHELRKEKQQIKGRHVAAVPGNIAGNVATVVDQTSPSASPLRQTLPAADAGRSGADLVRSAPISLYPRRP